MRKFKPFVLTADKYMQFSKEIWQTIYKADSSSEQIELRYSDVYIVPSAPNKRSQLAKISQHLKQEILKLYSEHYSSFFSSDRLERILDSILLGYDMGSQTSDDNPCLPLWISTPILGISSTNGKRYSLALENTLVIPRYSKNGRPCKQPIIITPVLSDYANIEIVIDNLIAQHPTIIAICPILAISSPNPNIKLSVKLRNIHLLNRSQIRLIFLRSGNPNTISDLEGYIELDNITLHASTNGKGAILDEDGLFALLATVRNRKHIKITDYQTYLATKIKGYNRVYANCENTVIIIRAADILELNNLRIFERDEVITKPIDLLCMDIEASEIRI